MSVRRGVRTPSEASETSELEAQGSVRPSEGVYNTPGSDAPDRTNGSDGLLQQATMELIR
jgi:hypothetical protein